MLLFSALLLCLIIPFPFAHIYHSLPAMWGCVSWLLLLHDTVELCHISQVELDFILKGLFLLVLPAVFPVELMTWQVSGSVREVCGFLYCSKHPLCLKGHS